MCYSPTWYKTGTQHEVSLPVINLLRPPTYIFSRSRKCRSSLFMSNPWNGPQMLMRALFPYYKESTKLFFSRSGPGGESIDCRLMHLKLHHLCLLQGVCRCRPGDLTSFKSTATLPPAYCSLSLTLSHH